MCELHKYIKLLVKEAITASVAYTKKELVRQKLQDLIVSQIKDGSINDQESLKEFFENSELAFKAIKMVPFQVWKKIAK